MVFALTKRAIQALHSAMGVGVYGLGFQHYEDVQSNAGNVMVALRPYLISRKKVEWLILHDMLEPLK